MTWPVVLFWVLLAYGLWSRSAFLIHLFFAAGAFGSLAAIPIELTGGINLLPQSVCAAALVGRVMVQPTSLERALRLLARPAELGILLMFLVVCGLATAFMPRLFAGSVAVITISGALDGPQPLAPGFYNVTQTAYMALSVASVVAFTLVAERPGLERVLRQGIVTAGATLCATGFAALAADAAGMSSWLAPFRTVSYTLITDAQVLGTRRLVGLMTEASSFGASCCVWGVALTFLTPCAQGRERVLTGACALVLFVMAALSTSSTAYVGLALWLVLVPVDWARRFLFRLPGWSSGWDRRLVGLMIAVVGVSVLAALSPRAVASAVDMIDAVLLRKTESASYLERMQWNRTALDAVAATGGLGVGLGSARASNWFIALVSNAGILGAATMLAFLGATLARRTPRGDPALADMAVALKALVAMNLALAALAGTSADFGVAPGAVYGMLTGLGLRARGLPAGVRLPAVPVSRLGPHAAGRPPFRLASPYSMKGSS